MWYRWQPPAGRHSLRVCSPLFAPVVGVYTGSDYATLTVVGSGSAGADGCATASFVADGTSTYDIVVDGQGGGSGSFTMTFSPPNDAFVDAATLSSGTSAS